MDSFISNVNTLLDEEKLSLLEKNFTSDELIEILEELLRIDPKKETDFDLFDCCGTGGDKANTFNISTATAILAASTGIKTCKNGGRSSSSKTGSVDVLEELGVNFQQKLETKLIGLKEYGLAFHNSKAIAETLAPLKNYARQNKISSFLSLLGPFTNPFKLKGQIIGVGQDTWFDTMTDLAKHSINKDYAKNIVLIQSKSSSGQVFDELTSITNAKLRVISKDSCFDFDFKPLDYGLTEGEIKLLKGGDSHKENAQILTTLLKNQTGQIKTETVLINLAVLLSLNEVGLNSNNLQELILTNYHKAKKELESGSSFKHWQVFLKFNKTEN